MNSPQLRISSIRFKNYKAFREYSVTLQSFNVLVGPNNAGKSTILGAIRILAEGIRRAKSRNAGVVSGAESVIYGYSIDLNGLPVSTENVFHDYNESEPAIISFRVSNGNELHLWFVGRGNCYMTTESKRQVRTTTDFKREFPLSVAFVPVLGPVEHNERLNKEETARLATLSHNASRNFRNTWYHFREGFSKFREMVKATWPGMDIDPPELSYHDEKPVLHMFCPEDRFPRELYWAGFGFQVWCQLLTFILRAGEANLLVIDEPDIYLHSDLQRQLVNILQEISANVVLATHSTEIISEVEPETILNVNKKFRHAKRLKGGHELTSVFAFLGSNLNPTLTQLAKTRRVVFVEGKDFQVFSRFAKKLGMDDVSNRGHFAVVPVGGFNPQKVKDFAAGMELTLGMKLVKVAVFDRDYRGDSEAESVKRELERFCWHVLVHDHKEVENYLLDPTALARAITKRNLERGVSLELQVDALLVKRLLVEITDPIKNKVQSQIVTCRQGFERKGDTRTHASNFSEAAMNDFDEKWSRFEERMKLVPGKDVISSLNNRLQAMGCSAITHFAIIDSMKRDEVPVTISNLMKKLQDMRLVPNED